MNPSFAPMISTVLEEAGYTVLLARDGQEALDHSRHHKGVIDLVITDVVMPKILGPVVCACMLHERPGVKVIVMSGADPTGPFGGPLNLPFIAKPL